MALRRSAVQRAMPIPPTVPQHDMWLGAIASATGRVVYLAEPLIQYRRHSSNLSPSARQSWPQMLRWRFDLACAFVLRYLALKAGMHRPAPARSNLS
jgi:hypothetical protein